MSRYVDIAPYEKCRIVSNPEDRGLLVSDLITIDAEPVRHGHWIDRHVTDFGVAEEFCGICEEWSVGWHKRYCPNCGAKMDNGG